MDDEGFVREHHYQGGNARDILDRLCILVLPPCLSSAETRAYTVNILRGHPIRYYATPSSLDAVESCSVLAAYTGDTTGFIHRLSKLSVAFNRRPSTGRGSSNHSSNSNIR